jgi:hypothetical protein
VGRGPLVVRGGAEGTDMGSRARIVVDRGPFGKATIRFRHLARTVEKQPKQGSPGGGAGLE